MSVTHMVQTVRQQASACRGLGSPLYADVLEHCADDIVVGGPAAAVLAGHEDDPAEAAVALRLLGAAHRMVLEGEAPDLARCYPSVGGVADPHAAWLALRALLGARRQRLVPLLDQPPQTNEVGRAAALMGGLLELVDSSALPVNLHEIGASGGLNLRADHFWYSSVTGDTTWGPDDSPVRLSGAWAGPAPPVTASMHIAERCGTDIAPLDVTSEQDRLSLLSYVWPDQVERFNRLRAAIDIARRVPITVERCDAQTAVARLRPVDGRWTVVWHSVMWQYLAAQEQQVIEQHLQQLGQAATERAPVARLFLEPGKRVPDGPGEFLVVLQTWPASERRILGAAAPHGVPTNWE